MELVGSRYPIKDIGGLPVNFLFPLASFVALIIAPHIAINQGEKAVTPAKTMENMPVGSSDASLPVVPNDATVQAHTVDLSDRF